MRSRRSEARSTELSENEAASAIQAWFSGNNTRIQEEVKNSESADGGQNGAASFKATNSLRRNKTMKMSKVRKNFKSSINTESVQAFFAQESFSATLKGIIDVQGRMSEPFTLLIVFEERNSDNDNDFKKYSNYFALNVDHEKAWFSIKRDGTSEDLTDNTDVIVTGLRGGLGLEPDTITTYWLSYDRDNMTVKYGKGYAMEETTLLSCDFSEGAETPEKLGRKRRQWSTFFAIYDENRRDASIMLYRHPDDIAKHADKKMTKGEGFGVINAESLLEIRREPLSANPSPFVLASSKATLNVIDKGAYIFSSELPTSCRVLYETTSNINLDMEFEMGASEVKLSDAIRRSIVTEGGLLNTKLKTKSYLRITLGKGRGESPGIPYVLEIWPVGARSIIHNHGAVCGVIKVLFGSIQVGIFNKVTSSILDTKKNFRPTELFKFSGFKGDTTWISPEWFQTHQLRNVTNDYCATIQCYRYDENDNIHWNMFDYVKDENGEVGNFFPNTDFTFGFMRKKVLEEWNNRLS